MGKTWERRDLCLGWEFQNLDNSREFIGAGNRIRTGDPDLGKVVLYQLSYSRSLIYKVVLYRLRNSHSLMYRCLFSGQRSQRSMLWSAIVVNKPWISYVMQESPSSGEPSEGPKLALPLSRSKRAGLPGFSSSCLMGGEDVNPSTGSNCAIH